MIFFSYISSLVDSEMEEDDDDEIRPINPSKVSLKFAPGFLIDIQAYVMSFVHYSPCHNC